MISENILSSFDAQSSEYFEDIVWSNSSPFDAVSRHYFAHVLSFNNQVVFFRFLLLINIDDCSAHSRQSLQT